MSENIQLQEMEQSLIKHLLRIEGAEDRVTGGARKIRSLSISIDVKNPKQPLCVVTIGMMSACFNVRNGLKVRGNCYGLDRYIKDWLDTVNVELCKIVDSRLIKI